MPCFHPIPAYRTKGGDVVFTRGLGRGFTNLQIPCGNCLGCRLNRARQWAIRCIHEASLDKDNNSFLTLTYNDENLPANNSLHRDHFPDFIRSLRKRTRQQIRYFHCGEYGDDFGRPHYHALLFGYTFPDAKLWREVRGNKVYTSDFLSTVWGKGFTSIGAVTFQSAAYVARYVLKKQSGPSRVYEFTNKETGEIYTREKEYVTMSRKPGLGTGWYEKFGSDVFPRDEIVMDGKTLSVPRFYDKIYECENGESALAEIKKERERKAKKYAHDQTPARLKVREKVAEHNQKKFKRELIDET
ncbi:MAG: replication initiator protein [Microvirus sp.]|nr:MAG: replication initiator protein [Microvirus sp.]